MSTPRRIAIALDLELPFIVEAILNGQEPSGLSFRQLHKEIPVS